MACGLIYLVLLRFSDHSLCHVGTGTVRAGSHLPGDSLLVPPPPLLFLERGS